MNNETALTIFNFEGHSLQAQVIQGELWWVAADVCKVLAHSDVSVAVSRLDDDEKLIQTMFVSGQHRNVLCVNESGLYHLIFTSRLEKAQRFRKWVTGEVLPSIRKTGGYGLPPEADQSIGLADRVARLEEQLAELLAPSSSERRRLLMSPEQEKEVVYRIVAHVWETYDRAMTANTLATSYIKRLSTRQAQRLLEELVAEGRLEHFKTPHTVFYGGKFKPARQLVIVS